MILLKLKQIALLFMSRSKTMVRTKSQIILFKKCVEQYIELKYQLIVP